MNYFFPPLLGRHFEIPPQGGHGMAETQQILAPEPGLHPGNANTRQYGELRRLFEQIADKRDRKYLIELARRLVPPTSEDAVPSAD